MIVYGRKLNANVHTGSICDIPFYENNKLGWERIGGNLLEKPVNMDNGEKIVLSFDWNSDYVEKLRIVCKSYDYIWDFEINNIHKGRNVVEAVKDQFCIQQGKVRWSYVDTIEIGTEFSKYVQLSNIKMEVR